jgi:hypothetical protein
MPKDTTSAVPDCVAQVTNRGNRRISRLFFGAVLLRRWCPVWVLVGEFRLVPEVTLHGIYLTVRIDRLS